MSEAPSATTFGGVSRTARWVFGAVNVAMLLLAPFFVWVVVNVHLVIDPTSAIIWLVLAGGSAALLYGYACIPIGREVEVDRQHMLLQLVTYGTLWQRRRRAIPFAEIAEVGLQDTEPYPDNIDNIPLLLPAMLTRSGETIPLALQMYATTRSFDEQTEAASADLVAGIRSAIGRVPHPIPTLRAANQEMTHA
jgi:hypothetical protein